MASEEFPQADRLRMAANLMLESSAMQRCAEQMKVFGRRACPSNIARRGRDHA